MNKRWAVTYKIAARSLGHEKAVKLADSMTATRSVAGAVAKQYKVQARSSLSTQANYMAEMNFGTIKLNEEDGVALPADSFIGNFNGMKADIEHANLFGKDEFDKSWLFEVKDAFFDGNNLVGMVKFNSDHKQFTQVWENIDEFGASLEYNTNDFTITGLTGTFNPMDVETGVLGTRVE